MIFDYSKNRFDEKVLDALFELANEHNLKERIEDDNNKKPIYKLIEISTRNKTALFQKQYKVNTFLS